jgi:hypothetical protein
MSALTRFFFRNEVSCRSTADVIGWWETRRVPFNVAVGATGVFTYAAVQLILMVPPLSTSIPLVPSMVLSLVYGVLANVCYTGGWIAEIWFRRIFVRYGFVFSIGLTLFPIAVASLFKFSLLLRWIL